MLTYPPFEPHFPRSRWTMPQVLEHQARVRGEARFLSWADEAASLTFAEANARTNRIARGLAALGVGKGDHVVLFLPNSLDYVLTALAIMKLGAVEVAVGESSKGDFLKHQLNLAKPVAIVAERGLAARLAALEDRLTETRRIVIWDREDAGEGGALSFNRIETLPFEALLAGDDDSNPPAVAAPLDPGAVLFTSGTTGPSKGVVMSHAQLYFFAEEAAQLSGLTPDDVHMTGFPLFHGNAQILTVFACLIAGAQCAMYERFSASDWIGRVRRSGATTTNLLGATMAFIRAQPEAADDRSHRLRRIYAAPLSPDLAPGFTERFGVSEFVNGFGQTEISLPFLTPPGVNAPPNAVGVLVDQWFEVRIADPDTDEEVAEGQPGELLVRPKAAGIISSGYLGMPEQTLAAWRNLWFHTGDAVRRDAEGWYYFVDRVKDALRRRGENISSFEVEAVVRAHPAVAECAVVAVRADEAGGEDEVKACVVPVAGARIDHAALIAWCDERMPYYMVPRYIEVMAELPQTPSEKVRKQELRRLGVTPRTWDRVAAGVRIESERAKAGVKA